MRKRTSESGVAWLPAVLVVGAIILIAILLYIFLHRHKPGQKLASSAPQGVLPPKVTAKAVHRKRPMQQKYGNDGYSLEGTLANQKVVLKVLPEYPDWAEEQGVIGTIKIRFEVTETGAVASDLQIVQTTGNFRLDETATTALKQWRFSPGKLPGQEAPYGIITFVFGLRQG